MTEEKTEKTEKTIRREKAELIGKRNLLKFISPHVDELLKIKDGVIEIADDSGLDSDYALRWTLDQLCFFEVCGLEENAIEEEESEETEEE